MQFMSAGQITDHDYHVILNPDFFYIQDRRTGHLVGTSPNVMTHNIFGSLTGFIFFPLRPPVLPILSLLLHPRHRFLSGIIIWVIFVFVEVF
jgi:hypothetical protein